MYRYLFLCRVHPKSGMDLAKHNKSLQFLDRMLSDNLDNDSGHSSELLEAWNNYKEETDGFVLETVPIASDKILIDPEVEAMPKIRESYPEAEMVRYFMIPGGSRSILKSEIATDLAVLN